MTAAARISQDDMRRATKAVADAGFGRAKIVMDLENQRIEIFVGDAVQAAASDNDWDKELDDGA